MVRTWQALSEGVHELPVVHAPQDPLSQTSFVPHDAPLEAFVPVSTHVDEPDAHDVAPAWHGFAGVHGVPDVHETHDPLSQTLPVPHDVPLAATFPVSPQTGSPVEQSVVPTSQAFPGVHAAPGVHAPHAPALQNALVPQAMPFVVGVPVSVQVAVPDAHDVAPMSQGLAGVHAAPSAHAPHAPLSQTSFVPHDAPFVTLVPVSLQTGLPVEHDVVPVWHAFDGVHGAPVEHVMQAPLLQTSGVPASLGPHDVPFAVFVPVSLQTGAPDEQTVVPTWHAFVAGVHEAPVVHAPHAPSSQTSLLPHDVPFVAFVPVSLQTGAPDEQTMVPAWHAFVDGVQEAPAMHEPQDPLSQTWLVPHDAPLARLVPVSVHTEVPLAHDVVPVWHGLAGAQGTPALHVAHAPLSQTPPLHDVPFVAFVPVSLQTGEPDEHTVVPT
jgi:hypothetical protein